MYNNIILGRMKLLCNTNTRPMYLIVHMHAPSILSSNHRLHNSVPGLVSREALKASKIRKPVT